MRNFSGILTVLLAGSFYLLSFSAFSQSTPPLDKPVAKPVDGQISESGRIQEKNDAQRDKKNSRDSDKNFLNDIDLKTKDQTPRNSGSQLHRPPGLEN
jgi:hypothetical protein